MFFDVIGTEGLKFKLQRMINFNVIKLIFVLNNSGKILRNLKTSRLKDFEEAADC